MARSMIGGLIANGYAAGQICASDPNAEKRTQLVASFGIEVSDDNQQAVQGAQVVILAVKPQVMHPLCVDLAPAISASQALVISIAAGIRESDLRAWLGASTAIVRTMPNTPALVQSGATALYGNRNVSNEQRDLAESLMRAVGLTIWVDDESLMDVVTALSGSGPAYFFLVMEVLEDAAVALGLPRDTARLLTLQTAFGAAKMALETSDDITTLRERVTSPGGTTEQAIAVIQEAGLRDIFARALNAAHARSIALADEFGKY